MRFLGRIFGAVLALALVAPAPVVAQTVRVALETPVGAPSFASPASSALNSAVLSAPALSVTGLTPLSAVLPVLPAPAIGPSLTAIGRGTSSPYGSVAAAKTLDAVPAALTATVAPAASLGDKTFETQKSDADATFDGSVAIAAAPVSADTLVQLHSRRPLRDVFIQQEHEGSLLQSDSRDSSGNVFRWYRPVAMRAELVAEVEAAMSWAQKIVYRVRRRGRSDPYAPWKAWSTNSRLLYLEKLEAAVTAEGGQAMNGKETLILERTPEAPAYLTKHPHLEPVHPHMAAKAGVPGARFLWPEIVSAKDSPATRVDEAIGRSSHIISQTGHAGTQYHVFMKVKPARLKAQLKDLDGAVQLFNDVLFARSAAENLQNISIRALSPWHAGRSARFARLVEEASPLPQISAGEDTDSEKHAFVGLRYWGMENGEYVISLEFRGVNLPWKRRGGTSGSHGLDMPVDKPERDYSDAQRWLTMLAVYAESVVEGRAPRIGQKTLQLNAASVEKQFDAWAALQGQPKDSYVSYAELAKALSGLDAVSGGYLLPFAADDLATSPKLQSFANEALQQAQRVKALGPAFEEQKRHSQYVFWQAYMDWSAGFERRKSRELETLLGSLPK